MIKARKGNLIVFGLSDENIRRLKNGEPIKFNLQEIGMNDVDVFIFNGKDEETMKSWMKDHIHPFKTIVKDDNAKNN